MVFSEYPFNVIGFGISGSQPDYFGRRSFKKPYVIEIIVESKDAESVSPGILPYNQIFGIFQSKFLNLPGSGVDILNP